MNNIITFAYDDTNVRTTTSEDGTPLFCGKDVASILGYKDTTNALKLHCKGVVKHHPLMTPGGTQQVRFITEPDLYRLITHSKLPEAEKFEAWVFEEVLPSIRKHGMYATPATIEDMIANPDIIIGLATTLKEERAARAKAEAEVEAQRPVAALGKAIETAEGDLTPSAFGKILSKTNKTMGPNKFCRWLLDNNFAFRNGQGKIIPMQDAVNRGILILTERIDTAGKIRPQLLVTPTGQSYFAGILSC
ncbi:BRO family protein [uncultured Rothia sp.]|uniref:BRO family protein n=1 Tax=uncultured Rothia sp. TaxID=316088 RepID=UPI0025E19209|nr:BRO family protein [uncultured Rothia sp.]